MRWGGWKPYVPVATRRAQAARKIKRLQKQGMDIQPVTIEGRKIARTFWGEAWCEHLEKFSDFENRLPRGRTYVRNGSVCHLEIAEGSVRAMVSGSEMYKVKVDIATLPKAKWAQVKSRCAGQISSLLDLLQGKLSKGVMAVVTDRQQGLFPMPGEMKFSCSCPDWAVMCKHVAAVLYGVGARLDEQPDLLFRLRGVDHEALIHVGEDLVDAAAKRKGQGRRRIAETDLGDVFGIEITPKEAPPPVRSLPARKTPLPKAKPVPKGVKAAPPQKRQSQERLAQKRQGKLVTKASAPPAPLIPTGRAVMALREKLGMSQVELAGILGVSASAVRIWEAKGDGILNLQARNRENFEKVSMMTKKQAWKQLSDSRP